MRTFSNRPRVNFYAGGVNRITYANPYTKHAVTYYGYVAQVIKDDNGSQPSEEQKKYDALFE